MNKRNFELRAGRTSRGGSRRTGAVPIVLAAFFLLFIVPSARAETVVWAVGDQVILRLGEGGWQPSPGAPSGYYRSIWGSSSDNVYVVSGATLFRYDGSEWRTEMSLPNTPGYWVELTDVEGKGWNDIYLSGAKEQMGPMYGRYGLLYHFDGSAWSGGEEPVCALRDIAVLANGCIYAGGTCFDYLERRAVYRLYRKEGGSWYAETPINGVDDYQIIRKVSSLQGANAVAVTGYGTLEALSTGNLVAHRDYDVGEYWGYAARSEPCTVASWYVFEHCPYWSIEWGDSWWASANDLWVCGPNGTVLHWTPSGNTVHSTPTSVTLNAIWGTSNEDVYAVGGAA